MSGVDAFAPAWGYVVPVEGAGETSMLADLLEKRHSAVYFGASTLILATPKDFESLCNMLKRLTEMPSKREPSNDREATVRKCPCEADVASLRSPEHVLLCSIGIGVRAPVEPDIELEVC